MIIYIPVEIPVRELPGHLLLSSVAASQGHQVLITTGVDLWLYKRLNLLSKGCYLLKNVNIPLVAKKIYTEYLKSGFDLYCQEQESSVLHGEFKNHLEVLNIKKDQVMPFKGVFCWGDRDTFEYKRYFESKQNIFFNVGSLRLELWKEKFTPVRTLSHISIEKPYILMVSNFAYTMGKKHWSALSLVSRSLEHLESYAQQKTFIKTMAQECSICCEMILAVKHMARTYPEYEIVVRPHPADSVENWTNIFCDEKNVTVISNTDSITPWIYNASVLIHNGCTTSIEAVIQKTPVISYGPERKDDNLTIPNMLGLRALNIQELDESLRCILKDYNYEKYQERSESKLDPIVATQKNNVALEIIKILEENSSELINESISTRQLLGIKTAKFLKKNVDRVRTIFGNKDLFMTEPELDQSRTIKEINTMAKILGIPAPKLTWVSKSCFLVEKSS